MTPYGQYAAGVEIHATTASNILDKSWIRRLPPFSEIGILLALTLFSTYVVLTLRPTFALALMICAVPVWILSAYLMFRRALFFPGMLVVVVAVPIAYTLNILTVYIRKKRTDQILGID